MYHVHLILFLEITSTLLASMHHHCSHRRIASATGYGQQFISTCRQGKSYYLFDRLTHVIQCQLLCNRLLLRLLWRNRCKIETYIRVWIMIIFIGDDTIYRYWGETILVQYLTDRKMIINSMTVGVSPNNNFNYKNFIIFRFLYDQLLFSWLMYHDWYQMPQPRNWWWICWSVPRITNSASPVTWQPAPTICANSKCRFQMENLRYSSPDGVWDTQNVNTFI